MNGSGLDVEVVVPSISGALDNPTLRPVLPQIAGRVLGHFDRDLIIRVTEKAFLRRLVEGDPVYLWSKWTPGFLEKLSSSHSMIFVEKFNGLAAAAKDLLDVAYDRAGLAPAHGIEEPLISMDFERIQAANYVFVANPISADNMKTYGVLPEKIILSSYGWEPRRMMTPPGFVRTERKITFLFVAVADIRKGTNLLLDAWSRAKLDAKLIIAGPVADEIKVLCADTLNRDDVEELGWTDDLAEVYNSADVFVFPTHEEGGPLVTFEAMGCGLPVVVSPMGATSVVRHGIDGYVIDPYDVDAWVEAMRRLAKESDLRMEMGRAARERAFEFTWEKVGALRRKALVERVSGA